MKIMGNVSSGRNNGEGTSGVKKNGYEDDDDEEQQSNPDHMLQLPFSLQSPLAHLTIPGGTSQAQSQNEVRIQNATHGKDVVGDKKSATLIVWSHGGKEVAISGSWDSWETIEHLHPLGKDFVITKILQPGIYHYCFIVDEQRTYAPELPWECDNSGVAYNILELQDRNNQSAASSSSITTRKVEIKEFTSPYCLFTSESSEERVPEGHGRLAEFESPPSPISSYDNEPLNDGDFIKEPPDLPQQLQNTILNEPSSATGTNQYLPLPSHTTLNHLYIQNRDGSQPVALGVTHRFLQKYVSVVIYKATSR